MTAFWVKDFVKDRGGSELNLTARLGVDIFLRDVSDAYLDFC